MIAVMRDYHNMKITNKQFSQLLALKGGVKKRTSRKRSQRRRTRRPRGPGNITQNGQLHAHHAMTLANPSQSIIPKSVYQGEEGIINRFTFDLSPTVAATDDVLGFIFHPNTGYGQSFTALGGNTGITAALVSNIGVTPGFTFLNSSARKCRGIASSIRFSLPSLNFSTISGEVACGVISADIFTTGSATFTADTLFQYAAARAPVSRGVQEVKWYPGALDDRYSTFTTSSFGSTGSDPSDTNAFYVVYRGIPVGTRLAMKIDWVCEWVPRLGTGFTPTYSAKAGIPHMKTVEHMHAHKPGWFHNLTGEVEAGAAALGIGGLASKFLKGSKSFATHVRTTPIIEEMEEFAPLMLTL